MSSRDGKEIDNREGGQREASPARQSQQLAVPNSELVELHTSNCSLPSTHSSLSQIQGGGQPRAEYLDFRIFPRRKGGKSKQYAESAVIITAESLQPCFGMPLVHAAKKLGICATALKKVCRKLGIHKWPYKELKPTLPLSSQIKAGCDYSSAVQKDNALSVSSFFLPSMHAAVRSTKFAPHVARGETPSSAHGVGVSALSPEDRLTMCATTSASLNLNASRGAGGRGSGGRGGTGRGRDARISKPECSTGQIGEMGSVISGGMVGGVAEVLLQALGAKCGPGDLSVTSVGEGGVGGRQLKEVALDGFLGRRMLPSLVYRPANACDMTHSRVWHDVLIRAT